MEKRAVHFATQEQLDVFIKIFEDLHLGDTATNLLKHFILENDVYVAKRNSTTPHFVNELSSEIKKLHLVESLEMASYVYNNMDQIHKLLQQEKDEIEEDIKRLQSIMSHLNNIRERATQLLKLRKYKEKDPKLARIRELLQVLQLKHTKESGQPTELQRLQTKKNELSKKEEALKNQLMFWSIIIGFLLVQTILLLPILAPIKLKLAVLITIYTELFLPFLLIPILYAIFDRLTSKTKLKITEEQNQLDVQIREYQNQDQTVQQEIAGLSENIAMFETSKTSDECTVGDLLHQAEIAIEAIDLEITKVQSDLDSVNKKKQTNYPRFFGQLAVATEPTVALLPADDLAPVF